MDRTHLRNRFIALVLGVATLALCGSANADPPGRVARLGYITGTVSFSPAGEDEWVRANVNRPLVTGDRLWADAGARTELQVGSATIRMGSSTSLNLLNVDDNQVQLQLAQGSLNLRVRRVGANEVFEVDTPNLAFSIRRPGAYRIDVDAAGSATIVAVRNGQANVHGEGAAYVINPRESYRFVGTGLRDYERYDALRVDEFDRWASERDRRWDTSVSARYVAPDLIGYQDLDAYGTWRNAPGYGNVWAPNRVAASWAPYHDGHWAWVDPWGWTWVDDAPWGFAVSHYGRWANSSGRWFWVPGPIASRPIYAPALVAFVGGNNFQLSISGRNTGGIGWFPLAPREVYVPAYPASREYVTNVNTSNTVINTSIINNFYNNPNAANVTYVNRQVPGAIIAVPTTAFVQAQSVARVAVAMPREAFVNAQVIPVAAVQPTRASLIGTPVPSAKPPMLVLERPVVANTAPPPRPVAFEHREQLLAKNPGRPLDAAAMRNLAPSAPVPAGKIQLVTPTQTASPTAVPPAQRPPAESRDMGKQRFQTPGPVPQPPAQQPPIAIAPGQMAPPPPQVGPPGRRPVVPDGPRGNRPPPLADTPTQGVPLVRELPGGRGVTVMQPAPAAQPPTMAAPPAPVPAPPAQHNQPEPRGKADKPMTPPVPASPQPFQVAPTPPQVAAPPVPRPQPEPRGKVEQPRQPPVPAAQPPAMAPAPVATPPEPRGKPDKQRREPAPVSAPPQAMPAMVAPPATVAPPPQPRLAPPAIVIPPPQAQPAPPAIAAPPQAMPAPPARIAPPPQSRPAPPAMVAPPAQPRSAPPAIVAPPQATPAIAAPPPNAQPPGAEPKAEGGKRPNKKDDEQKAEEEDKKRKK